MSFDPSTLPNNSVKWGGDETQRNTFEHSFQFAEGDYTYKTTIKRYEKGFASNQTTSQKFEVRNGNQESFTDVVVETF